MNLFFNDLGETMPLANKMESTSRPGEIRINEETYNLVNKTGKYDFEGPELVAFKVKLSFTNNR